MGARAVNKSVRYYTSLDFVIGLNRIRKSRIMGQRIAEALERGMCHLQWEMQIRGFSYVAYVHIQVGRVAVVLSKKCLKSELRPAYYITVRNLNRKRTGEDQKWNQDYRKKWHRMGILLQVT